ncbi:EF-hand domain-containing protein [Ruegeria arenilitoris]|uniref:EF-hand domain-containing protein n=1 Tax=Ruegeria arenilitoris TaxID=1173585 RepID=UPI00147CFA17|nr:EF-hand domain-containing protein [Ruegeria arenilitoris]
MQNWDLNGDGTAALEELQGMRGNVFFTFDANEDGYLDAEEYVMFDEAGQNDVNNYEADQRAQMQAVADGWFADLDTDHSGTITLVDFNSRHLNMQSDRLIR